MLLRMSVKIVSKRRRAVHRWLLTFVDDVEEVRVLLLIFVVVDVQHHFHSLQFHHLAKKFGKKTQMKTTNTPEDFSKNEQRKI